MAGAQAAFNQSTGCSRALNNAPNLIQDAVEHRRRQSAREGVLLAHMVGGEQDRPPGGVAQDEAVREARLAGRQQAMAAVESPPGETREPNTVVQVMQKGYSLHDRVVRPALVTVAKQIEKAPETPISDSNLQSD